MFQGRIFSYPDTHMHRLGANYLQIPVNCPFNTKARHYQRDGPMTVTDNQGSAPNYFPNSFSGPVNDPKHTEHPHTFRVNATADCRRWNSADDDNFTQVGIFWNKVGLVGVLSTSYIIIGNISLN